MAQAVYNAQSPLGIFPLGKHDSWQFHFFCFETQQLFSLRLWYSGSVQQAWAWTTTPDSEPRTILYISNGQFSQSDSSSTVARKLIDDGSTFRFTELSNESHAGVLEVDVLGDQKLRIEFTPGSTHFWGVPGQSDGVFHFPDLSAAITYQGVTLRASGYCKRYFGDYDGPWGYQFIQGIAANANTSVWTADATFGDNEYNYFKIYDVAGKSLIAADAVDTYHNNLKGFWRPLNGLPNREVELTEFAKKEFFLKSAEQHSKLVERFGFWQLKENGRIIAKGGGVSEKCFGTVG